MNKLLKTVLPFQILVLIALLTTSIPFCSDAQEVTKIMGIVRDAQTGDTLPFVSIYFKDTQIGSTTGFDGHFSLESKLATDTLVASYIGYNTYYLPIQKNRFQTVDIRLQAEKYELQGVVIHPRENPAEIILRKIIHNKPNNDPDKVESFQCKAYTKMQFDVNNITEKFKNKKILQPFKFIFEQVDTSVVNGKIYLPIMISETFSDLYSRKTPRVKKEIIRASQISGIDNPSMSQFVGNLAQDVKIYDNFIVLFQKNFISPIANLGLFYYKYYLVDSSFVGNKWCYNIMFKPRHKQEFAFTGNFWVNDTSFAIKKLEMRMANDANINFVNDMMISQEFDITSGGQWMLSREKTVADFNLIEDAKITTGFFGTRTVLFSNYDYGPVKDEKIYSIPNNIIVLEDANFKTDDFWKKSRPEALTRREASVYRMSDTLNQIPLFRTYVDIIKMLVTGYYVRGNFEWGPYASTYSYNALEGNRLRVGGRTSNKFSTHLMLNGSLAYGTLDQTLKYNVGFMYMLGKKPDRVLSGSYKYDMEQLGQSEDAFRQDFILNSIFRRNPQNKLSMVSEYKAAYKHEWFTGFSNTLTLTNRRIFIHGDSLKLLDQAGKDYLYHNQITTTALTLDIHYGIREKTYAGEFERVVINSHYPVFNLQVKHGVKGFMNGDFDYNSAKVNASQWFNFFRAGWLQYNLEAGKIWGKLPYPLLNIYPGNETFYQDDNSFNLMNYYEFISDEYATYHLIYHMEGFFLNRIPAIRKLKWREVATLRGAIGHLSTDNYNYNDWPNATRYTISKPYMEAGVGIENIFKIFRVDAVWRLTYNEHPNTKPFGILVSMYFDF